VEVVVTLNGAPNGQIASPVTSHHAAFGWTGAVMTTARRWAETGLFVVAVGCLVGGGLLALAGQQAAAGGVWAAATVLGIVPGVYWVVGTARQGRLGVDVIAVLAQVGTLAVGEYLAGAIITVMLASGRVLEARAGARAERDLRALVNRAPLTVHRYEDSGLSEHALDDVCPGDLLLIRSGEVLAVDGLVESNAAVLDESALTGEPLPVAHPTADSVRSGTVNAGAAFDLRATTTAAESTYAGVVRLVEQAQASSAPFVRMADRFAVWFLLISVTLAAVAWAVSGDAVRAVAVLVVATPCPLILAAPVAIVSGLSRSARVGVIVKGGGALERLAGGTVMLLDKTGTLTEGRPTVAEVVTAGDMASDEVLQQAASLEQVSPHVLASAVVRAGRERGLPLVLPDNVEEVPGHGVRGWVEGHEVTVGSAGWILPDSPPPRWVRNVRRRADLDGALTMFVAVDGEPVGAMVLDDPIRADAPRTIRALRRSGIQRVEMVTGDRADVAESVGAIIGVDLVLAERTPTEKVQAVTEAARYGSTIMVGDGINDAPALALADVGVAVGARGATASSEAADVVLTVDRLDRLAEGIAIAQRSQAIARQSVIAGMSLSGLAMIAAAFGLLAPVWGAILQEAIDVAVILNALRALTPGRRHAGRLDEPGSDLARRFSAEHLTLRPDLDQLRVVADDLGSVDPDTATAEVWRVYHFLADELLPHEEAEDAALYPAVAAVLGGTDPTGAMSRTHVEIGHHIRRLGRLLDQLPAEGPDSDDLAEMRRLLYGLHAILRLHFAQEDEGYLSLAEPETTPPSGNGRQASPGAGGAT
jgi:heavy metal translocating P-type ATPase